MFYPSTLLRVLPCADLCAFSGSGNPITATKTFKPRLEAGEIQLEFTFESSLLAGEDVVAFESLFSEGIEIAVHADIDDEDQSVHFLDINTTATDKADGDKLVTGAEITISDEVSYEGLVPGTEYVLQATLMDAETGDPITVKNGFADSQVISEIAFTPEEADGTQVVDLTFDGTDLGGKKVVVFEKILSAGVQLASHEDLSDEGQTVSVCEIGTKLVDADDGGQVVATGKVSLVDTVEYKGLIEGDSYTVHGTIMVKSTGEALADADGNPITATADFVAKASEGTVDVTFEVDTSSLKEGDELVAFEEFLSAEGNLVAAHRDINDDGQTVVIDNPDAPEAPKIPYDKTGATAPDDPIALIAIIGVALVGAGVAGLAFAKYGRKKPEGDASDSEEVNE